MGRAGRERGSVGREPVEKVKIPTPKTKITEPWGKLHNKATEKAANPCLGPKSKDQGMDTNQKDSFLWATKRTGKGKASECDKRNTQKHQFRGKNQLFRQAPKKNGLRAWKLR